MSNLHVASYILVILLTRFVLMQDLYQTVLGVFFLKAAFLYVTVIISSGAAILRHGMTYF